MLGMESKLGAARDIRWGPRTIDLDLLLYEEVVLDDEELMLPHPTDDGTGFRPRAACRRAGQRACVARAGNRHRAAALRDRGEGIAQWNTINWQGASAHSRKLKGYTQQELAAKLRYPLPCWLLGAGNAQARP